MDIRLERRFLVYCARATCAERATQWARGAGFAVAAGPEPTFTRGSLWWAFISFDIRKIPTRLLIKLSGELPVAVQLQLQVRSPILTFETPKDRPRLEADLDGLERQLREGAPAALLNIALPAPGSARCGAHPERSSALACERCGAFACPLCQATESHCLRCYERLYPGRV